MLAVALYALWKSRLRTKKSEPVYLDSDKRFLWKHKERKHGLPAHCMSSAGGKADIMGAARETADLHKVISAMLDRETRRIFLEVL